jgi:hypothetical protein
MFDTSAAEACLQSRVEAIAVLPDEGTDSPRRL